MSRPKANKKPRDYHVTWAIDLAADSARAAAREALATMRDPHSLATFFTVEGGPEGRCSVDLRLGEGGAVVVNPKGRVRKYRP
jgi:hypothetical protein